MLLDPGSAWVAMLHGWASTVMLTRYCNSRYRVVNIEVTADSNDEFYHFRFLRSGGSTGVDDMSVRRHECLQLAANEPRGLQALKSGH